MECLPHDYSRIMVWHLHVGSSYSYPPEWFLNNNLDVIASLSWKFWSDKNSCWNNHGEYILFYMPAETNEHHLSFVSPCCHLCINYYYYYYNNNVVGPKGWDSYVRTVGRCKFSLLDTPHPARRSKKRVCSLPLLQWTEFIPSWLLSIRTHNAAYTRRAIPYLHFSYFVAWVFLVLLSFHQVNHVLNIL